MFAHRVDSGSFGAWPDGSCVIFQAARCSSPPLVSIVQQSVVRVRRGPQRPPGQRTEASCGRIQRRRPRLPVTSESLFWYRNQQPEPSSSNHEGECVGAQIGGRFCGPHAANPDESRSCRIDSRNPAIWFQVGMLRDATQLHQPYCKAASQLRAPSERHIRRHPASQRSKTSA